MRRRVLFPFGVYTKHQGRLCTVPNNEPKRLAGCYGIYSLLTGKWYIGSTSNVSDRRYEHEREVMRQRMLFHVAVHDLGGIESFVFVPLFYMNPDRAYLAEVETSMIYDLDSLAPNGFNLCASKRDDVYWSVMQTPEARNKVIVAKRTIEARTSIAKSLHTPEVTAKRNAAIRDPEVQARKSITQRKAFADPAFKAKHAEIMVEIHARPEVKAKKSASVKANWERRRQLYGPSGQRPK